MNKTKGREKKCTDETQRIQVYLVDCSFSHLSHTYTLCVHSMWAMLMSLRSFVRSYARVCIYISIYLFTCADAVISEFSRAFKVTSSRRILWHFMDVYMYITHFVLQFSHWCCRIVNAFFLAFLVRLSLSPSSSSALLFCFVFLFVCKQVMLILQSVFTFYWAK